MNRGEQLLRGRGVSQQVTLPEKPYEWGGIRNWDPAKLGPMLVAARSAASSAAAERARDERSAQSEARRAEFGRHRAEGLDVMAAGRAVGVSAVTAKRYERLRVAEGAA